MKFDEKANDTGRMFRQNNRRRSQKGYEEETKNKGAAVFTGIADNYRSCNI